MFQIDFYGYDMGDPRASATFRLHAPTRERLLLVRKTMIGEDPAGGGTDLDATINVNLGNEKLKLAE